jgi:hypothetical protein
MKSAKSTVKCAGVKAAAMEATTSVKTAAPESFLTWAELDVRLIVAWITPLNRRGTVTAERGFVAHLLLTEVLPLNGHTKLVF